MKTFVLYENVPQGSKAVIFTFRVYKWGVELYVLDIIEAATKERAFNARRRDYPTPVEVDSVEAAKPLFLESK